MDEIDQLIIQKKQEMDKYCKRMEFYQLRQQNNKTSTDVDLIKLLLQQDPNQMDRQQILSILNKVCSTEDLKRLLLKIDLKLNNVEPKQITTASQLKVEVQKILYRYYHKIGGHRMEEAEWQFVDYRNRKHGLSQEEIMWINTIPKACKNEEETESFMDAICNKIKSFGDNIKVSYKFEKLDDIYEVRLLVSLA